MGKLQATILSEHKNDSLTATEKPLTSTTSEDQPESKEQRHFDETVNAVARYLGWVEKLEGPRAREAIYVAVANYLGVDTADTQQSEWQEGTVPVGGSRFVQIRVSNEGEKILENWGPVKEGDEVIIARAWCHSGHAAAFTHWRELPYGLK